MFKDLLRFQIECYRQENAIRRQIKSNCREFNVRRLFSVCFSDSESERVTSTEIKRFFTVNGRMMERERIERSLIRTAEGRSDGD
jgi:hypothetical protein